MFRGQKEEGMKMGLGLWEVCLVCVDGFIIMDIFPWKAGGRREETNCFFCAHEAFALGFFFFFTFFFYFPLIDLLYI